MLLPMTAAARLRFACFNARTAVRRALSLRILALVLAVCGTYASIPLLGIGQAQALTSPTNNCKAREGSYWNCSQAQALAECKRFGNAFVEYQNSSTSYPRIAWRTGANSCSYKI